MIYYRVPMQDPTFDVTCSSLTRGYFTFEFALDLAEQNFGATVDVVFAAEGRDYARTGVIAASALNGATVVIVLPRSDEAVVAMSRATEINIGVVGQRPSTFDMSGSAGALARFGALCYDLDGVAEY